MTEENDRAREKAIKKGGRESMKERKEDWFYKFISCDVRWSTSKNGNWVSDLFSINFAVMCVWDTDWAAYTVSGIFSE